MKPFLSACLIVKNESEALKKTLPSIVALCDQVIVVDTGSTDATREVAITFGAQVKEFPWQDDFAAARNGSLQFADGEWVLWIDADEFIPEEELKRLREHLGKSRSVAHSVSIFECPWGTREGSVCYSRAKLFRNGLGIHFERPFNEQLYTAQGELLSAEFIPDVRIYHWGRFVSPEKTREKKERNLRILQKLIQKQPEDACYHFLLANNLVDIGDAEQAVQSFRSAIQCDTSGQLIAASHLRIAKILTEKGSWEDAYRHLREAAAREPWNAEIFNRIGMIYLYLGNVDKAIQVLQHAKGLRPNLVTGVGINMEEFIWVTDFLLSKAFTLKGDAVQADAHAEKVKLAKEGIR